MSSDIIAACFARDKRIPILRAVLGLIYDRSQADFVLISWGEFSPLAVFPVVFRSAYPYPIVRRSRAM